MSDLISKIRKKDSEAVTLIYNSFGKKLYRYAVSKWTLREDDAWELVYKTLYRVIEVIDNYSFENEGKFSGFIFKIFINYLRNHYRDNKNKQFTTVELNERHGKVDKHGRDEENTPFSKPLHCLKKVLDQLIDWQRILLLMRAQDFSYEQIAPYVEKPADQLKVYHMRLKKYVGEKTNECINTTEQ